MEILRFRGVKCVSDHIAGEMQSWALNPGLLVPERFQISSGGSVSSAHTAPMSLTAAL